MTGTQELGHAELERLNAVTLCRPRPVRDRRGRWHRDPGGEWDWLYQLPESEQEYIRAHHMTDRGVRPDELADWLGTDIDTAGEHWAEAVRLTRRARVALLDPLSDEWADAVEDDQGDAVREIVLGLAEIADRLGVAQATAHKWRTRALLPAPDLEVSRQPAWFASTVDAWAAATGRNGT